MFEPKTFFEKRLTLMEALLNQILGMMVEDSRSSVSYANKLVAGLPADADENTRRQANALATHSHEREERLNHILDTWGFRAHAMRDEEAQRVIGTVDLGESAATRVWMENILRHNYGVLEVYGKGLHNFDEQLPGNDPEKFQSWLNGLENAQAVIRDSRASGFYKDQGSIYRNIPALFINNGRELHMFILTDRITAQTISLDHLPNDWDWDSNQDMWRIETHKYLNTMTKYGFLRGLAEALKNDGRTTLFVPEGEVDILEMSREFAVEFGLNFATVKAIDVEALRAQTENLEQAPVVEPITTSDEVAANDYSSPEQPQE